MGFYKLLKLYLLITCTQILMHNCNYRLIYLFAECFIYIKYLPYLQHS